MKPKANESEWLVIQNSDVWSLCEFENSIMPILKLSYDNLPIHLRQCFAFCSLFPKDHEIEKDLLVQLWMAQGYIQSSGGSQFLEEIGDQYFEDLLSRSFFQDAQRVGYYNETVSYKMHDLIHDLALRVDGTHCRFIAQNDATINISERLHHVSFENPPQDVLRQLLQARGLRTYFSINLYPTYSEEYRANMFLISKFKRMRALGLRRCDFKELPNWVCKMQHLRYLDLSRSFKMEVIPNLITNLVNLQMLNLSYCYELKELPEGIGKLISLRHLVIDGCYKISHMPRGLEKLTSLRTLSRFIVGADKRKSVGLGELKDLNKLAGRLSIEKLEKVRDARSESKAANLMGKQYLRRLILKWYNIINDYGREEFAVKDKDDDAEILLEGLQPHPNLRNLGIDGYCGERLPSWMMGNMGISLPNIVEICFSECPSIRQLPPTLYQLPCLKNLYLGNLPKVEEYGCDGDGSSSSSSSPPSFPSLTSLEIDKCPMLTSMPLAPLLERLTLESVSEKLVCQQLSSSTLSRLSFLRIKSIEDIEALPLRNLTSLETLWILHCPRLLRLAEIQHLTALEILIIKDCEEVDLSADGMNWQALSSLRLLEIDSLPKLVSLPEGLQHVTTLQSIRLFGCPGLVALPEWTESKQLRAKMASRAHLLPKVIGGVNKVQNPHPLPLPKLLCTSPSPPNLDHPPPKASDRHEQVRELRILLQQGRTDTAQRHIKSLILSKSSFSSPSELFSLFTLSSPALQITFSNMLLSVCSESKLLTDALELYALMKKERIVPSLAAFNVLLESLVTSRQYEKTLILFSEMVDSGVLCGDRFAYGKAVQAAVKLGDIKRAMELVNCMKKRGVGVTGFVYNVVISGLCKEKRMTDAQNMFAEMTKRKLVPNCVTYNTLIDGYCKAGCLEEAFNIREKMKAEKVEPNIVTFNSLLGGLCKSQRMEEAKKVLKEMEAHGFAPDTFTWSILFDGFSRSGDGDASLALYEETVKKGVQINHYNSSILLNWLCKEGKVEKAEEVLKKLIENGFVPTEVLYNTIVKGYCRVDDMNKAISKIEQIEVHVLKPSCITFNTLIGKFCEMRKMDEADNWVKKMTEKGVSPNVETYNILIDGYGRMGAFERCFQILEEMDKNKLKPNVVSYGSLINCLCKGGKLLEAEVIFNDMVDRGVMPNAQIYNMLIDGHCKAGKLRDAFRFYDDMLKNEMVPTIVTYNTLINGLCKKGRALEAEELVLQITSKGLRPDVITYNSLISGYSDAGNTQKCLDLYENMKKSGLRPTVNTYHPLICGFSKQGLLLVEKMYQEMLEMKLLPDQVVYNALIHSFVEHGEVQRAFAIHREMVDRGIHPDKLTYNSLILGHFKEGRLMEVRDLVNDMKAKGLVPKADTFSILVEGHSKLNDFNGAYAWYREMVEIGFLPSVSTCNELITGLRKEGRLQEVRLICSDMSSKGMDDYSTNDHLSVVAKM